jgi:hypothetical protein
MHCLFQKNRFFSVYKTTKMLFIILCPFGKSSDDKNGSMWTVVEDTGTWMVSDLGKSQNIKSSELYFVSATTGHAYELEYSNDGKTWKACGGHRETIVQTPHIDNLNIKARFLRVKILIGVNGIWEWHIH